jgi:hypothetical protein
VDKVGDPTSVSLVVKGGLFSLILRWLKWENNPASNGLASEVPPTICFMSLVPSLLVKMTINPVAGSAREHMSGHARLGSVLYEESAANPF